LPVLFQRLIQSRRVTVVLLHDIDGETADKVFAYLSRRYNVISLQRFIDAAYRRDPSLIPPMAMIITIDDGRIGNHRLLPSIKKYGVPITIFLCAEIVGTRRHFWFMSEEGGNSAYELKTMPNALRIKLLGEKGFDQGKDYGIAQALQREHIEEMSQYVDFQSHTSFHPCLPKCSNDEAEREIVESRRILKERYGLRIDSISYPHGDYSDRDVELVKRAGYKCALTVDFGFNTMDTDPYRIKRIGLGDTDNMDELVVKASGVWGFLRTLNGRRQRHGWTDEVER
jgi:peptidoglycan/xylan/chitin deacetylase (PgdA/CDA1 family)